MKGRDLGISSGHFLWLQSADDDDDDYDDDDDDDDDYVDGDSIDQH